MVCHVVGVFCLLRNLDFMLYSVCYLYYSYLIVLLVKT